jgi:hypothetical protein
MNILVKPYGSNLFYCRPDTTWERENKDFYSPECVNEISWTPVVFARICKAGKCIGEKFVDRYYDSFNFGVLMYCKVEGTDSEAILSAYADHTSILPHPLYNPVVLEGGNKFTVQRNGDAIYQCGEKMTDVKRQLIEAICKASELTSLRIGDFVAVELTPGQHLSSRTDAETTFSATYCENEIFSFKIIF